MQSRKCNKDFNDAVNVIAVQTAALDWSYLRKWCEHYGTLEVLDQACKKALAAAG